MGRIHNERGAGRKLKYNVPTKSILVPVNALHDIEVLCAEYLTKQNQKITVTQNISSHFYDIGEEVTIICKIDNMYRCINSTGEVCYLTRNEFDKIG